MMCGIFEMVKTSAPYLENLVVTYVFAPLTSVTTAITLVTPMTTPSSVNTERSLFAQSDCSAILTASLNSIGLFPNHCVPNLFPIPSRLHVPGLEGEAQPLVFYAIG